MKHFRVSQVVVLTVCAILLVSSALAQSVPEPAGWYAGDMHVHRSCGESPEAVSSMFSKMTPDNLSAISLLADIGNGEVQNTATDLPLVNGQDEPISTPGRILHWDADWHWDSIYPNYPHAALGGHIVALGLSNAHQIWDEYTYPIFDWAHQQNGIAGFAHLQYLGTGFPQSLTCCTPIEYPVEVALGSADFISEDVDDVTQNTGGMDPESFIQAYYRLLNSGFRPGFAAGTDYPCNGGGNLGNLLTYVQVAGGQMSYRNWIDGIAKGRTVVSRNGHNEFLNLTVNGIYTPGDEIKMSNGGNVQVTVQWTASENGVERIELVQNGVVVASQDAVATPGAPATLTATVNFNTSGWLAARTTVLNEHYLHTAAVFVTVNNAPVRASAADTQFYVNWINSLLQNTSPGGQWNQYFPTSLSAAQARYQAAGALYQQIASEASGSAPTLTSITLSPANQTVSAGTQLSFIATGTYSNGTTLNITGQTRWTSSNVAVATVNSSRGLASAVGVGTTTISASLGGVTASTILTVQKGAPLAITTQSLAGGTVGTAYSSKLAATGGTPPYVWSIASSSLPTGLSLDGSTGVITGTPAAAGTFSFTVQATDSSIPLQTASTLLSIAITNAGGGGSCPCTIWATTAQPGVADSGPDSPVELGVKFRTDVNGYVAGIRFYKGASNIGTHVGNLWSSAGVRLATATFTGETTTGWQQVSFSSPVVVTANTTYVASYFAPNGHYSDDMAYFAGTAVNSPPLHALADGTDGPNGVYAYGSTSVFPGSGWNSSNYWVDVILVTNAGPDTTPPSVSSVSPTNGATTASLKPTISATFTEAVDPNTINANTFQLFAPGTGNTLVPGTVAYSGGTASFLLGAALAASTSYTAVVRGGSGGVKDLSGNVMAADFSWSFATPATPPPPGTCPCSIWSDSTVPAQVDSADRNSVELGLKFRSDVDGVVTGIRFYKASSNTGAHIGNLWTSSGRLLATATFNGESTSGWQQVTFGTPVPIVANTTYLVSYFAPNGHYSDDARYFASSGTDNAPLHALGTGVDGPNGLFGYSPSSAFPTFTYDSTNYWVDVIFVSGGAPIVPTIISTTPPANSSGIGLGTQVVATFNEPMEATTVNTSTILLLDSTGNAVPATVTYDNASWITTLTPALGLSPLSLYTVVVKGGAGGVRDSSGNTLTSDFRWSFTTGATPPDQGPGGPILVIATSTSPFTQYYGEILSAEGLNEYALADISTITSTKLGNYDLVILSDMSLTSAQAAIISTWVNSGGRLIAMHPDKQLASLLGLSPSSTTLTDAYLLVQNGTGPGAGIVGQTIQFHGSADLYTLNGASSLATLYSTASVPTTSPAVTLTNAGAGQAAAFTYDLARSVIYTRQGNPAWSGQARDQQSGPIRSDDLFFGAAVFDPQSDWVDLTKVTIPQADEQQRLLANVILQMDMATKPLPRFWYFPSGVKAVVVMTGDDHGNNGTQLRFSEFIAASRTGCSVADWQCVRSTSYLFPQIVGVNNPLTDSQAATYVAQGFEISVHADSAPDCTNWTTSALDSVYTADISSFAAQFPSVPAPQTHRMHCVSWSDYDSQPKVELAHGIRFDTTYYYWPSTWINDQPGLFTGSGMPMRFADRNGNILNIYQAPTQMTDESGQSYPLNIDTLLGNAVGTAGYYGAFVANMHNDLSGGGPPAWTYPGPGANQIVASAQAHGVPVVSSLQMLQWLDGRNSSSFGSISWSGNTLTFNITQATGARNLEAMLPTNGPSGTLSSITLRGNPVTFTTQTIKGMSYAMFAAATGTYQAVYGGGAPAVVLTLLSVNPTTVIGGSGSTGTVTLSGPAPIGGATVTLSSSNTAAQTPPTVVVASGNTSASFAITTAAVSANTSVTITGSLGGTQTTTLTVTPVTLNLSSLALSPTSVQGGTGSTGTVTISGPAPAGGVVITLASNNSAAVVPASVTVVAGATAATFGVSTNPVASSTVANISATYGGSQSAALTVTPPSLSSLTLNPTTLIGGSSSTGTLILSGAAPVGGLAVTLSSSNTSVAQVPASVTVAAGSATATFTVTTSAVAATGTVNISGTYGSIQAGATLTVNAATLSTFTLNPTAVVGGASSTGTVTLTGPAPTGGAAVALQSSNTAAASVPSSVTVAAGRTSATFAVTTHAVGSNTSATITGTLGASRTATLTVNVATLSSISRSPTSVVGGANSTGTVTLNGAAPAGGALVTLQSSNTAAAQVPASVTIAAGSTSATFTITTTPVTANTSVTITGTYGIARTTTLTVNAATLSSIARNPTSVVGGNNSTGTVTLNGAAPAGGAVVTLQSSNTSAAKVPASVTIAAGSTSTTFTITTSGVASSTSVTLTGVYGNTRTTTLTVSVASLTSLSLNPGTVVGGSTSTGTLTLNGAAPPLGAVVSLTSSTTSAAQVPASATIPAGSTSTTFTVTTSAVQGTSSNISGTYRSTTRSATLTIQ
jgi:hypothetical protein